MSQQIHQEQIAGFSSFGGQATFASATVGRGIFADLLMLQTLMVAVLAPAATAGTISSEREHQTLELLAVTPISSFAIVVGKLLSALAWVFVLVLASIPVTALVFVFGGVAPDDVVEVDEETNTHVGNYDALTTVPQGALLDVVVAACKSYWTDTPTGIRELLVGGNVTVAGIVPGAS